MGKKLIRLFAAVGLGMLLSLTAYGSALAQAQETQVSGTVLRYYTDAAGYVTAMDVQTANGVQMVTFAPGINAPLWSFTWPMMRAVST